MIAQTKDEKTSLRRYAGPGAVFAAAVLLVLLRGLFPREGVLAVALGLLPFIGYVVGSIWWWIAAARRPTGAPHTLLAWAPTAPVIAFVFYAIFGSDGNDAGVMVLALAFPVFLIPFAGSAVTNLIIIGRARARPDQPDPSSRRPS